MPSLVEGDALIMINTLFNPDLPPCFIQKVVEGSKFWLQSFQSWKASHVLRYSNTKAHLLPQHASSISNCVIWVEDTPLIIANQVCMNVYLMGFSPK